MTVNQIVHTYSHFYELLRINDYSVDLVKDIWTDWKEQGKDFFDVDAQRDELQDFDIYFFADLVRYAEQRSGYQFRVEYCAFILNDYNFSAYTATDGYIVFADERFLQFLFVAIVIMVYHAVEMITKEEIAQARQYLRHQLNSSYFNKGPIRLKNDDVVAQLLRKDYDVSEFANYLYLSIKAFIFAHEFGHLLLGHTSPDGKRKFMLAGATTGLSIDSLTHRQELDADAYGYELFQHVSYNPSAEAKYAFLKFRIDYAPLLFFDFCAKLDQLQAETTGRSVIYDTHPSPVVRSEKLQNLFSIDVSSEMYQDLRNALDLFSL